MSRTKKVVNPAAQKALNQMKVETANEIGLPNYESMNKGSLTSADNGRVGGAMVKKMIQSQQQQMSGAGGAAGKQAKGTAGKGSMTSEYDVNQKP